MSAPCKSIGTDSTQVTQQFYKDLYEKNGYILEPKNTKEYE